MMRIKPATVGLLGALLLLGISCARRIEDPFTYPFVAQIHLKRVAGKPYSDYKGFYLLTEDFEPKIISAGDVDEAREVLRFASELSSTFSIPWTHFVDVNTIGLTFTSNDAETRRRCAAMIDDLKAMVERGDDVELHLHGLIDAGLVEHLEQEEKRPRVGPSGVEQVDRYRQRRSFFFNAFYREGYRRLVLSLICGKRFLEESVYGGKPSVVAFRPGGWDHGSSQQDAMLYFAALEDAGLAANSGLSSGDFGSPNWRVGHSPGTNVAKVTVGEGTVIEISPTSHPSGYLSPVAPDDIAKLVDGYRDDLPVIVSVYHLGALRRSRKAEESDHGEQSGARGGDDREALERHFRAIADLRAKKVLYPITVRRLLELIAEQR